MEIEKEGGVRWPKPIRTDPEKRNKDLYCRFHKDTGHKTDDCRQLKDEIEFLIRKGKLSRYTRDADRNPMTMIVAIGTMMIMIGEPSLEGP